MTTLGIELGGGLVMGLIALGSHIGLRKLRRQLPRTQTTSTRRSTLLVYTFHLVIWSIFGLTSFRDLLSLFFFATLAVIYLPLILQVWRTPIDDHAAQ
jgi:hypothetical protein